MLYVTKLPRWNVLRRCEDEFRRATLLRPGDFFSAERVWAGGTFSYPLRDWDIVLGEWPDYRPSTRITFLLLIIGCTAKNHLHPPSLDFQIENLEWVGAEESESEQPPWNASHSWPPQTHSRSWFGAEGSVQKELLAQALKISDVCVLPRLFAEHNAADHVISSLSPAVGLLKKITIWNRFDLFPGRTSKELRENINKEGSAWGLISFLYQTTCEEFCSSNVSSG